MKRYIRANLSSVNTDAIDVSVFENTPFKPDTTTSYYNDFLNTKDLKYMQTEKNRNGEIVMMSPNEYIQECATAIFNGRVTPDGLKSQRYASHDENGEHLITKYASDMKSGDKFPLCYINYANGQQEGLHRMMAAGEAYGWNTKFPVLAVTVYDDQIEHENIVFSEYISFRDHDFDDICNDAAYEEILGRKFLPDDLMLESLKREIIRQASIYDDGYDIDVDIDLEEVENNHILNIYITRFEDYDTSDRYEGCKLVIEDYIRFDNGIENSVPTDNEDFNPDDIDILDLFYSK